MSLVVECTVQCSDINANMSTLTEVEWLNWTFFCQGDQDRLPGYPAEQSSVRGGLVSGSVTCSGSQDPNVI